MQFLMQSLMHFLTQAFSLAALLGEDLTAVRRVS
jgi:hypothetical protein